MAVDVVMFLLMGLAVAYLVARMGDAASLALAAYAAALLTVVGLSFLLAALGEQLEGGYDRAVVRFVASLVGAFVGVRLASRQRSLISSGGDLPIWIGDNSVGLVLAAVVVGGVTLLELHRLSIGIVPASTHAGGALSPTAPSNVQPSVALGTDGTTPAQRNSRDQSEQASAAAVEQGDRASPVQKNSSTGAPPQSAQGADNSPAGSKKNKVTNAAAETTTGTGPRRNEVASAGAETATGSGPQKNDASEAAAETMTGNGSAPVVIRSGAHGASAAQLLCANWHDFANMIRACVALPCEQCRGQQEMRHALTDKSVVEFSRGFADCNSRMRSAIELGNRCIAADNKRALAYGAYFLGHPNAPVPKSP